MARLLLVTGGARSGKSSYAERRALELAVGPCAYIATGEAVDDEFSARIERHRAGRDSRFVTFEEPLHIERALTMALKEHQVVVLECITTWLGNVFHHQQKKPEPFAMERISAFLEQVRGSPDATILVVSNEIGMGLVPADAASRAFRDMHGRINRVLAEVSTEAWLIVSGLPLCLKPSP